MTLPKIPQLHILIGWLVLLLAWKLIFWFNLTYLVVTLTIFVTGAIVHLMGNKFLGWKITSKNSFVFLSIFALLITSWDSVIELCTVGGIVILTFLVRAYVRFKNIPIINPTVIAWLFLIILWFFQDTMYISWSWVNYSIDIAGRMIPFGTIISVLLCIILVSLSRKQSFALWFFLFFFPLAWYLLGKGFALYALTDGTIYFFFGVMALEPKTGVNGKHQALFGMGLALMLILFLYFHVPGDYIVALLVLNLAFFTYRFFPVKKVEAWVTYKKWQKWICLPCGYIYDPLIWDLDSGIKPGTEFTDIPDNWSCPDCWVSKWEFIPYLDEEISGTIVESTYLNPTTLELQVKLEKDQKFIPGQYMKFNWSDDEWSFTRQYSIAEKNGNIYTFTIKIGENSRGWNVLKKLKVWDRVNVWWVFGNFTLKNTKNPKIFIATGTGLAPIFQMILSHVEDAKKTLYFSVAKTSELFYIEKLKEIKNLDLHIHVTREDGHEYEKDRVDIHSIEAIPETEFYICGSPKMVSDVKEKLKAQWYKNIYTEEFI